MKVFLSWSGERSKAVAEYLQGWLQSVIQSIEPWFSPDDIKKGSPWLAELNSELEAHSVAIICLTLENRTAPWLLFEAGALSKALKDKAFVCPLLIGLEPADVQDPLAQFQLTRTTKEEIRRLLLTINGRMERPLSKDRLDESFELRWPRLETKLSEIAAQGTSAPSAKRPKDDILAEILEQVRNQGRRLDVLLDGDRDLADRDLARSSLSRALGDYASKGALSELMGLTRKTQPPPPPPRPLGSFASGPRPTKNPPPAAAGPSKGTKR